MESVPWETGAKGVQLVDNQTISILLSTLAWGIVGLGGSAVGDDGFAAVSVPPQISMREARMARSNVYYMDAHSESTETSLVAKMLTVFDAAELDKMVKPNDIVAIKIHCGEWNNTAYLRPVYARALADRIKELGGRPFVCDTTTLHLLAVGLPLIGAGHPSHGRAKRLHLGDPGLPLHLR